METKPMETKKNRKQAYVSPLCEVHDICTENFIALSIPIGSGAGPGGGGQAKQSNVFDGEEEEEDNNVFSRHNPWED